jgi:hypothetical protein
LFRGRAIYLSASVGSATGLAEQSSFFRSLADSLSPTSGIDERTSLFRYFSDSLTAASLGLKGSFYAENPRANFNPRTVSSGHYDCHENVIANCGTASGFFAVLVIATGVLVFGIYVYKQRPQSPARSEDLQSETVLVDDEGWESRGSGDEEGWETKPED